MRRLLPLAVVALCAVAAAPSYARDYTLRDLRIEHPHARPTPPGARTGGAYLTIRNGGKEADRLLRVSSPAAATVELHSMTMDGNVMRMRAITALDIPAGATVTLGSSGYHVMLIELARPLAAGSTVPLTLTFEKSGTLDIVADVEPAVGAGKAAHGH